MLLRRPRPGQAPPPPVPTGNTQRRKGAAPKSYRQELGIALSQTRLRLFGELVLACLAVTAMTAAILTSVFRSPASVESPSPPSLIVTGATVREMRGTLWVPASSVVMQDGRNLVFRLQRPGRESKVRALSVVVGRRISDEVEVLGSLAAGDRIVAHGAGVLVDHDLVRVEPSTVMSPMNVHMDEAAAASQRDAHPAR